VNPFFVHICLHAKSLQCDWSGCVFQNQP
jgi:hypothetical protein